MRMWLAAPSAALLAVSSAASAQVRRFEPTASAGPSAVSSFMLPAIPQYNSKSLLQDGMIAQDKVAPNVHVGVGLAPMLGRNIRSVRIEQEPVPTSNPGVTLVYTFSH